MTAVSPVGRAILGALFIVGTAALLNWFSPSHISAEWAQRLTGALLGAVVVVYANSIPKAFASLANRRCSPAQEQAARRFSGWAMVLGGIGYMLASLFAPIDYAALIGGALLAAALILSIVRYLRVKADAS